MEMDSFDIALREWTEHSNRLPMLDLLEPFAKYAGIDIEESYQKGSDCGAIEIQGRWIAPYEDVDSGDAAMFLLRIIKEVYKQVEISFDDMEVIVSCFKSVPQNWDGPSVTATDLPMALLRIVATCLWPKESPE